jgi:hypothetical protein
MSGITAFFGAATVALAGIALVARRGGVALLCAISAVAFLLSLGPQAGLYGWVHRIPPLTFFRAPVKLFPLAEFSIVWAAALGADVCSRWSRGRRTLGIGLVALTLVEHTVFVVVDDRSVIEGMYRAAPRPDILEILAPHRYCAGHAPTSRRPWSSTWRHRSEAGTRGSLGALVGVASLHAGGVSLLPRAHAILLYEPLDAALAISTAFSTRSHHPPVRAPDVAVALASGRRDARFLRARESGREPALRNHRAGRGHGERRHHACLDSRAP